MSFSLIEKVFDYCIKTAILEKSDPILVGFSGGQDSLCLLHLLNRLAPRLNLRLTVAHLNHQLRGSDSLADEQFVRELAHQWQVPLVVDSFPVSQFAAEHKLSLEDAARQLRYHFLGRVAAEIGANKIAVGHNADDQAETVLMHLLRGSGLTGLRGMLPLIEIGQLSLDPAIFSKPFSPSLKIIRPLLDIPRAEIEAYCQTNELSPRYDTSNEDPHFYRNRVRHELLPYLESYNPNIRQVLQRTAKISAAEGELIAKHAADAWQRVVRQVATKQVIYDLNEWRQLPLGLKRALLRQGVQILRSQLRDLSFEHVETAIAVIDRGLTGTKVTLPHGLLLTVGYETLSLTLADHNSLATPSGEPFLATGLILPILIPGKTTLPATNWQIKAEILGRQQIDETCLNQTCRWEAYLDADKVGPTAILRGRQTGDIFYPFGLGGHRKKLKAYMVDEKVPVKHRATLPLLVAKGQILWVCGYRLDERVCLTPATQRILHLKFEPVPPQSDQPHTP